MEGGCGLVTWKGFTVVEVAANGFVWLPVPELALSRANISSGGNPEIAKHIA